MADILTCHRSFFLISLKNQFELSGFGVILLSRRELLRPSTLVCFCRWPLTIDYESKVKCVWGRENAGALCGVKGHFSDVEFDGRCRMIQVSNFVIVGVRMALAIEMKTGASPSLRHLARITQRRMVWDGSASMSTCSYSSRSGYRNSRCWSRHNSQFRSTQISLTTHMAERSPLLLCILPTKGMSFVFLFAYLRPPLCPLHVESPKHLRFENDTGSRRTKVRMKLET